MEKNRNEKPKDVDLAYDVPSWFYDIRGYFILRLTYRSRLRPLIKFFSKNIGKNHLEVAIGSGTFFEMVLNHMRKNQISLPVSVDAFDYAQNMLLGAYKRFNHYANFKIIRADVMRLPYHNNSFDTLCIANAIHCFSKLDLALQELYRVTKEGGSLSANVLLYPRGNRISRWIAHRINDWGIKKGVLFTPYDVDTIKKCLANAGYKVTFEELTGNMLNIVAVKPFVNH